MSKTKPKTTENVAYTGVIPRNPLGFLLYICKPFKKRVALVVFFVTGAQVLSTLSPYVIKLMVDTLTSASSQVEILSGLKFWGTAYVGAMFLAFCGWRLSGLVGARWLADSKAYSYTQLYDYLLHHSHNYYANRFAGSVANKVSHASDGADNLIEQVTWHYYPSVMSIVGTCILFFFTNFYIGITFLFLVVALLIINIRLVKKRHPLVMAYATASSLLRGVGVDLLTNIMAMKQYSRRTFEQKRLNIYVADKTQKDFARDFSQELGLLLNNSLVILALILIIVAVYFGFASGVMTVGDVVLVLSLLSTTMFHLIFIGNMLNGFIRTYGEIEEGLDDILLPYEIEDQTTASELKVSGGEINWQKVTFLYGDNNVFNEFDLTIKPGERIGLVGPSGAGKTTFVSLLLRQHDLTHGAILIDGQNIAEVTQDSLRENVAVVPQEPMLFHRSIRENIAYGKPDATDEEINQVARKAQAYEFIASLPDGFETEVGERGVKLSGGQKQRVAIARAMLKNAPILVLDEATSALDSESEVAIQKALHELMAGKTVVAIAHRLSTLREMDRIIVLEGGKIVEDGTHTELAKAGGTYARLWEHQAGGFLQD